MASHVEKNVPVSRQTDQITPDGVIRQVFFRITQKDAGNGNLSGITVFSETDYQLLMSQRRHDMEQSNLVI